MVEFFRAKTEEAEKILAFYYDLIDGMQGAEYPLKWTKGVYPLLSDLEVAAADGTLYYAVMDDEIVGAFIVEGRQPDGYENVPWTIEAEEDKVAVLHLIGTSPRHQRKGLGKLALRRAMEIAAQNGSSVMRLDTLTWNVPGQKLYESVGFNCCGDIVLTYACTGTIPFRTYEISLQGRG